MKKFLWVILLLGQLAVVRSAEPKSSLAEPARFWVKFVSAAYEGRQFAMSIPGDVGVDPQEIETYSHAIKTARAELIGKGELLEKEFSFKTYQSLFEVDADHPLEAFFQTAERDFSHAILQEFFGLGFDFQVKIANQRKEEEFDKGGIWKVKVALPKKLMKGFEEAVKDLVIPKGEVPQKE